MTTGETGGPARRSAKEKYLNKLATSWFVWEFEGNRGAFILSQFRNDEDGKNSPVASKIRCTIYSKLIFLLNDNVTPPPSTEAAYIINAHFLYFYIVFPLF